MNNVDIENIPQHIAIIMDGNGRWATERGKDRSFGHQAGVETVRRITSECTRLGVKYLTLYTFSTENWNRPADEVAALMGLVLTSLEDEIFMKNNVRFRVIGDIKRLPEPVQQKLQETMEHTTEHQFAWCSGIRYIRMHYFLLCHHRSAACQHHNSSSQKLAYLIHCHLCFLLLFALRSCHICAGVSDSSIWPSVSLPL